MDNQNTMYMTMIFAICRHLKISPEDFVKEWKGESQTGSYGIKVVKASADELMDVLDKVNKKKK